MNSIVIKQENSTVGRGGTCRDNNMKRKHNRALTEPDHVVEFLGSKRQKTEQDHLQGQKDDNLDRATRSALEGDELMVHLYLQQATANASKLLSARDGGTHNQLHFLQRVSKIRGLMTRESQMDFHKKKFNQSMESAKRNAFEGNKYMMEFWLREAWDSLGGLESRLQLQYYDTAPVIRGWLTNERSDHFHLQEMEKKLSDAQRHANKGDRFTMEFCLQQFKDAAGKVTPQSSRSTEVLWKHYHQIRSSLCASRVVDFIKNRYNYHLKHAQASAECGDRSMLEFHIMHVESFGFQLHLPTHQVEKTLRPIRNSLFSGRTIEPKKEKENTPITPPFHPQGFGVHDAVSNNADASCNEVILEKEVSLDDRLAQQLQHEEKAGRVIHLE